MAEQTLKEKTARGLMWGAVNNLTTQLLSALIGIMLGRLMMPSEYGMMGLLAVFTAVASTLQESGFTAALTNPKQVTHREYNAVFWFSTLVSLAIYGILFLAAPLIARFYHEPGLVDLSRLVFASLFMAGIGTAHAAYMFRNMMNREKTITGIVALVVSGFVGITLALNGYSYWSLAWNQFVYITIADIGRLYYVRWRPSLKIDFTPIREMFGFSSKILVTNIITQVNNNILSLIFGRLFSAGAVGNYTQAAKWNTMGHSLISGTIQQVAQPVLASIKEEEGRQLNVFRKMLRFTAFLSMPAMLGLALIADFIVLLLGQQWVDSVQLLRMLCISGAFLPIQTLYQNLLISQGRSDTYMWCTLTQILVQIGIIILFSSWGVQVMVAAYSLMLVLWIGIWQTIAKRLTGLRFRDVAKDILPFLLSAVGCIAIAYYATVSIDNHVLSIGLRILIAALVYMIIMKLTHAKIFEECVHYFLKKKTI